jgi:hypothetical protein
MTIATRNKDFMQLCWVVPDLEAAIGHWVRTAGAGPFFVFGDLHFDNALYRGAPADVQPCRATIGQLGDMQIELIQPTDDGPGLWTDVIPRGKSGLHHVGLYSTDYDADRARYMADGAEMAFEGLMMGHKTCYNDTVATLGFMTELITANPVAASVFEAIRVASQGWNGSDPIRSMG